MNLIFKAILEPNFVKNVNFLKEKKNFVCYITSAKLSSLNNSRRLKKTHPSILFRSLKPNTITDREHFSNINFSQIVNFKTSIANNASLTKEWSKILSKAEKVVGYPTSFLNLRFLVSDEVAHFANLLRKLMQTKHPLIKMAKRIFASNDAETKQSLKINGLIVLLISKAAGMPKHNRLLLDSELSDGIHNSQRCLAEIAEMIHTGSLIHKGVLDLKTVVDAQMKDMDQGNKLAVLCGDYLLASACNNLSKLHNTQVVDLMSQVIADTSESIFKSDKNSSKTFLKLWYENVNSNSSSLMANSAKAAMLLVRHSAKLQEIAFNFAQNLDITHKIWSDLMEFKKDPDSMKKESIIYAIYFDNYRIKKENLLTTEENNNSMDFRLFYENILSDCKQLFEQHYLAAMQSLEMLEKESGEPHAVASLKSILNVMRNSVFI